MAQQIINVGAAPDDGTGDPIRTAGIKINDNFTELYAEDAALDGRVTSLEGAPGGGIDIEDEGTPEATAATTLNFTGAGVTASDAGGGVVDITIPGGGGALNLDDLGDVDLTGAATGDVLTKDAGGDWVPAAPSGGGGSTAPTMASTGFTTWENQGSATAADSDLGIAFAGPGELNNHRLRGLYKAAPSAPYTATAAFEWGITGNTATSVIFGWRDSVTAKAQAICVQFSAGTFRSDWTNTSTGSFTSAGVSPVRYFTLQVEDDGTNIVMRLSLNGIQYAGIYSVAKASGFLGVSGYNQLIVGMNNYNGAGAFIMSEYEES